MDTYRRVDVQLCVSPARAGAAVFLLPDGQTPFFRQMHRCVPVAAHVVDQVFAVSPIMPPITYLTKPSGVFQPHTCPR